MEINGIDGLAQQVAEMIVDADEDDEEATKCIEIPNDHPTMSPKRAMEVNGDITVSEMYSDYAKLKIINEKLLTKFLKSDDIDDFEFLFKNIEKKPKLSLLGQSGAGKSTLINKIVGNNVLDSSSGKGAVTQYPVELIYDENINFNITINDNIEGHEKKEIFEDKTYLSEYHEELINDDELLITIYDFIDKMNNEWEIPYDIKKDKYMWKVFNKKINGDENGKFHFKYETIINDKEINVWVNVSPFIKKLSISLDTELLKIVTLVDLPGLYDKSEIRTRKTKDYLNEETDFIMIVENNDRAATSSFIDNSLNSFIVNVIVKKQIPDILLTLTNIDRTYESSIKEVLDSDGEDDYDEDNYDEVTINSIKSEFKNRLNNTEIKIKDDIQKNECLQIHNLSHEDINILFYSSKIKIDKLLNKSTVGEVIYNIEKICSKRKLRYGNIIHNSIKDHYNNIKTYINTESIHEEEKNKIKQILSEIKEQIFGEIVVKLDHRSELINDTYFPKILAENERYSNRLSRHIHGLTLSAVLRKLIHQAEDETKYNLVEDLSIEYTKLWGEVYEDFVANMNRSYYSNIKKIDHMKSFIKLKDINNKSEGDGTLLKKRIKQSLTQGGGEMKINGERHASYEKYLDREGLSAIEKELRSNIEPYHSRACEQYGVGHSYICRGYLNEMLSVANNMIVKTNINRTTIDILKNVNSEIIRNFHNKINDIFVQEYGKYGDECIDIDEINDILDSMNSELYYSSDEAC